MSAKRFFIGVLAAVLLLLGSAMAFLMAVDPLMTLHPLEEGETALFSNQRYEMPGLIRNQDYSAVVMGTSLVANYRASWFTEALGAETLKITFPDGWVSEFDTALNLAFDTHPELERVFFCLDPNILIRPDSERTVELPQYLYNTNPLDDVSFYLNADSLVLAAKTVRARAEGRAPFWTTPTCGTAITALTGCRPLPPTPGRRRAEPFSPPTPISPPATKIWPRSPAGWRSTRTRSLPSGSPAIPSSTGTKWTGRARPRR